MQRIRAAGLGMLLALAFTGQAQAHAGKSWVQEKTSLPIHHAGLETELRFELSALPQASEPGPGSRVTRVFVWRRVNPAAVVRSQLCLGSRCVPLLSDRLETLDFAGLDARQPVRLKSEVLGEGPLRHPEHIRASVIVWHE